MHALMRVGHREGGALFISCPVRVQVSRSAMAWSASHSGLSSHTRKGGDIPRAKSTIKGECLDTALGRYLTSLTMLSILEESKHRLIRDNVQ